MNKTLISCLSAFLIIACNIKDKKPDDGVNFKIIKSTRNKAVLNLHFYLATNTMTDSAISAFVFGVKSQGRNIFIYNDSALGDLVDKYPLDTNEYIRVADHFVAMSTFDQDRIIFWPFQDTLYRLYGGKNNHRK